jgi:LacI family transcriptional regulator
MKKIMMADVARLANVSTKTVSRVINNSPQVSDETRKRVLEIIEREKYTVNVAAQGLKGRKTKTIIVFIDVHGGNYWGIWHNEIVNTIIKESKKTGYRIVISPSSASGVIGDETDGFYLLKSRLADGAIIFDNKKNDVRIKYLLENDIPYVLVGKAEPSEGSHYVDLNNYKVGFIGGEYLVKKGYDRIVQFIGSEEFIVNKERVKGFQDATTKYGKNTESIFNIDSVQKAYEKAGELLDCSEEINAFFVSGDERSFGVYRAILERNLRIPEDVAVLGIDNIYLSRFVCPALSTVDQFTSDLGKIALDMLMKLLKKKSVKESSIIIEPKIVERKST